MIRYCAALTGVSSRAAEPGVVDLDMEPTLKKKSDPDLTIEKKTRTRLIFKIIKFTLNFFLWLKNSL